MSTTEIATQKHGGVKEFFAREDVRVKFKEMMGKRHTQFITSVLQIVNSNALLREADPISIYNAAAVAATLDLPLNNNLGFAYIVPYNQKIDGEFRKVAQFQMGYKGFIQLAQRSGQFLTIDAKPVYEGQMVEDETFAGFSFNWKNKKSDTIIGYAAYFKLLNGFEKTLFMTAEDLRKHGVKYSQTFKKGYGLWKDDFDAMAVKTVLKLLLSKYAPLSVEMQKAVVTDQAIVNDAETEDITYVDNTPEQVDKESERVAALIGDATEMKDLAQLEEHVTTPELKNLFDEKVETIKAKGNGRK